MDPAQSGMEMPARTPMQEARLAASLAEFRKDGNSAVDFRQPPEHRERQAVLGERVQIMVKMPQLRAEKSSYILERGSHPIYGQVATLRSCPICAKGQRGFEVTT